MATQSELDSLDLVELLTQLEKSGFEIADAEFAQLHPFLVSPYPIEWQLGSLSVFVDVIAQNDSQVLAIDDSGNAFVGNIEATSQRGRGTRYRSLNLASREFIGIVGPSAHG